MNVREWNKEDFKKYIENNSKCKFIDTWIKKKTNPNGKNRRYLKLLCECGEIFECPWVDFNSEKKKRRQCKECSKIIGYKKKSINNEHYEKLKKEKGVTIKHLEDYKGRRVEIAHECPICKRKDWIITPASILNHKRECCRSCSDKRRMHTNEHYISKKKELGIDIVNVEEYKGLNTNIIHICPCCGDEWKVSPHRILSGNSKRCVKCSYEYRGRNATTPKSEVKAYIESVNCKWVDGEYENQSSMLIYECECGNTFSRTFKDFRDKSMHRCSKCSSSLSIGEYTIKQYLEDLNINYNQQQTFADLKGDYNLPLYYDFSIIENGKIVKLIEFDGLFHYKPIKSINGDKAEEMYERQVKYDKRKDDYAKKNNIPLIRISCLDFKNIDSILDSHFK